MRFAEELLLFLLDEPNGALLPVAPRTLSLAFAGSVLMDLEHAGRIDTDLDTLVLTDGTPLDDDLLDPTLADIAAATESHDPIFWVERTAERGPQIRERATARLVDRGVLLAPDLDGFLALSQAVARTRRYPSGDEARREDVRLRLMRVLFDDEIPDPADIAVASLAEACGVFPVVMTASELAAARERIALLSRMDLIGQAVAKLSRVVRPLWRPAADAQLPEPPAAQGRPLVGNALDLMSDATGFFAAQHRRLGPVFRIRLFSNTHTVLAGRDANLFMLRRERFHLSTGDMWEAFRKELGASRFLLGMDGAEHLRMRRALKDGFSRARFHHHVEDLVDIIRRQVAEWPLNEPLPGFPTIQRLVTEQVGMVSGGYSAREYVDDLAFFFKKLVATRVLRRYPAPLYTPRFRRALRRVEELCDEVLASHQLEYRDRPNDLIDDLIALHRADPMFLPETDLSLGALLPFIVGIDTSASAISFMLYALLKHPDLWEQVRAEADALFASGGATAEGIRGLDVTRRVAMETLRLFPVAAGLRRTVATSFDFGGHRLRAGEPVVVATAVTHYLPEYFPEPERFDIDRYLPERAEHRQAGLYVPFGVGAHRCLGADFAEGQIVLTLAALVHDTRIALDPPDYEMRTFPQPFNSPRKEFRFRLLERR